VKTGDVQLSVSLIREARPEPAGEGNFRATLNGKKLEWASSGVEGPFLVYRAEVDADLVAVRKRLGVGVIERKRAPKEVLRSLRKGRAVGILGDQNVRRGGVFVEFFGKLASTPRGAALFALRTGSPVFLGMARSLPGSPQRYEAVFEPVEFTPTGQTEEDILRFTEKYARLLEERIRGAPEQYFWQHRRWKTRPKAGPQTLD
jgi:KDO2-lipid IV(A) lauroyltransferase